MSKMTELASGAITAVDTVTIELGEADETPSIVIVTWPAKATVFHPRHFRLARIGLDRNSWLFGPRPAGSTRVFHGCRYDRARGPSSTVQCPARISRVRHVGAHMNKDLGQSEDVGVEIEADGGRLPRSCHAARADVS
jgi:hypothetical protein